jgi:uncharacterized protein YdiU (UPF0061 family)
MNAISDESQGLELGLGWHNRFANLGPDFYSLVTPQPLPRPYWVGASRAMARELGLEESWLSSQELLAALSGNALIAGTQPLASVYSGHQFGVWAGQLGDGRAILLGQTVAGLELQLKGAGLTPYSRSADGRAVLRSSVREFLASEAMHGLRIASTRALCVTGSDAPVYRETVETAAVVTRVAPSFVRFGHFEHFSYSGRQSQLKALADHVIDHHYPECRAGTNFSGNAYAALLAAVSARTALLMAQWQAVGFCHGVMNTDNMSILGLTIDYGPFQFLDAFDPGRICNHSDTLGRYAFNRQPQVAYWNLFCLAQALAPLIEDQELALQALEPYKAKFSDKFARQMLAKLGLTSTPQTISSDDLGLIETLLQLLAKERVDYNIFWRRLSHCVGTTNAGPVNDLFLDRAAFLAWWQRYQLRSSAQAPEQMAGSMLKTNPKYVLRNHLAELAIQRAKAKDFSQVSRLLALLEAPFDEHPECEEYANFPPDWASSIEISCSS